MNTYTKLSLIVVAVISVILIFAMINTMSATKDLQDIGNPQDCSVFLDKNGNIMEGFEGYYKICKNG